MNDTGDVLRQALAHELMRGQTVTARRAAAGQAVVRVAGAASVPTTGAGAEDLSENFVLELLALDGGAELA